MKDAVASNVSPDPEAPCEILDAKVVAMYPPRPDAIMTLLHSDDFLPGAQTLLYSLKKTLSKKQNYPPEIVVLVTSNVSLRVQESLFPALCTRIIQVDNWTPPEKTIDSKLGTKRAEHRSLDNHCPGWTKLRIFGLQQYDTILYIDSDCLVLKDVSSLLELNKVYAESEALIAAAPDLLHPDQFNSGVMVVRPSRGVLETMQQHASLLTTFDGSDTGFLNAYFNNWSSELPPMARLSVGYNAQEAMYDMATDEHGAKEGNGVDDGRSSFWDTQVGSDLYIIHYSNPMKPWEAATSSLVSNELRSLWTTWHKKSNNYLTRCRKEKRKKETLRLEQEKLQREREAATKPTAAAARTSPGSFKNVHKLIQKRFRELRSHGKSTKDAMQQARKELSGDGIELDAGSQVAAMFGMR